MIALKFLGAGRTGVFSGFAWPAPGTWVRTSEPADACRRGIHACSVEDLPWWIAEELWRIELGGEVQAERHKLVAGAGRLVDRVEGWTAELAGGFGRACAWRAHEHRSEEHTSELQS